MAIDDDPLLTYVFAGLIVLCILVAGVLAPFSLVFLAPVGTLVVTTVGAKRLATRDGASPTAVWVGVAAFGLVLALLGAGVMGRGAELGLGPSYFAGFVTAVCGAVLCSVGVLLLASLHFGSYDG